MTEKYRKDKAFSNLVEARYYVRILTHRFGLFNYEVVSLRKDGKHIAYGIRQNDGRRVLTVKAVKKLSERWLS